MNDKLFSILLAMCLGLTTFSLKFAFDSNAEIEKIKGTNKIQFDEIQKSLDEIISDNENDIRQDKVLNKLWNVSSWSRTEINILQYKNGDLPSGWPEL